MTDEDDIFASWKNKRFVVIDYSLFDRWTVVLTDHTYWTNEYESLRSWCCDNNAKLTGVVVEFDSEESLLLFVLTWS